MAFDDDLSNDPIYQEELAKAYKEFNVNTQPTTKQNSGFAGDVGTGLKRGVEQIPGMATGLADIPLGLMGANRPISKAADWLGEKTGFQPGKWAEEAGSQYSPQLQEQLQNVDQAQGFWDTAGAYVANPRAAANLVTESLPSTVAGGFIGKGLMTGVMGAEKLAASRAALAAGGEGANVARGELLKAGATAGGIGEGAVTAGQQMSQTGYDVDPTRAAATAAAAGIGTGLIGRFSGKLANKLGIEDIDADIAAGVMRNGKAGGKMGYAKGIAGGALTEGVLEELPQSMQEQVWQNVSQGKPWDEGVMKAGAAGMIAGGLMGAGVNLRPKVAEKPAQDLNDTNTPVSLLGHNPEIGTSWNNTYNYNPIIAEGSESQVPLQQLDMLHMDRMKTEAGQMMNTDFSNRRQDALYDMPSFDFNDQTLPMPTDPGSAVAVIQVLSRAQEKGQALPDGSRAHEALVEAQRILTENGLSVLAARAPQVAAKIKQTAVPVEEAPAPKPIKSKFSQAVEDTIAENITAGTLTEDHPVVAAWNASKKQAKDAHTIGKQLAEVLKPAQEPVPTAPAVVAPATTVAPTATVAEASNPVPVASTSSAPVKLRAVDLTAKQQPVYDHILGAITNDNADEVIDASGVFKYTEIGEKLGIAKGSVESFVNKIAEKIAKQNGMTVATLKASLQARAAAARTTMVHDNDRLGLSPDQQAQVANEQDYLGGEGGAEQSMGIINSVGGSQGETDGVLSGHEKLAQQVDFLRNRGVEVPDATELRATVRAADATKNDVKNDGFQSAVDAEIDERKAARAKAEADAAFSKLINHPEAKNAALDWNDAKLPTSPEFNSLTRPEQAELVAQYMDAAERGDWNTIESALKDFERQLDTQHETVTEATARIAGPTESTSIEPGVQESGGGSQENKAPVVTTKKRRVVQREEVAGTKFSKLAGELAQWKQAITDWVSGKTDRTTSPVVFSSTPASLQDLGLPNLTVRAAGSHFIEDSLFNHGVKPSQLADIAKDIADPVAVFVVEESNGNPSINILTRQFAGGGQLVVALRPNVGSPTGVAHMSMTVFKRPASKIAEYATKGQMVYQGDTKEMSPELAKAVAEAKKKFGQTTVNLSAMFNGKSSGSTRGINPTVAAIYSAARTGTLKYKTDLVKLIDEGKAEFSKANGGEGSSVSELTSVLKDLTGRTANPKVKIVQSVDDLTPAERAAAEADAGQSLSMDEWGTVQGFVVGGKSYLIADNIPKGAERAVFMHEVGAHMGLEKLLSNAQLGRLVSQLKKWAAANDNSQESKLAKQALERVQEAGTDASQQDIEHLAYFIEEAVKAGIDPTAAKYNSDLARWFRSLWAAFSSALRSLGLNPEKLSAQDIVDLAYGAAHIELNSSEQVIDEVGADPERVKFSKTLADRVDNVNGKQALDDTTHFLKKIGRSMEFLNDAIDRAKAVLPSAQVWYDAFQRTQSAKNKMERKAEDIAAMAEEAVKNAERYKIVNKFIGDSTFEQKWGYQPAWMKEKVQVDSAMAAKWRALTHAEQKLADAVFKHGDEFLAQRDAIFDKLGIKDKLTSRSRLEGPYAPLKRFGNYVAVLKSAKLKAAEAAAELDQSKANKELVDTLKRDPEHFVSSQFDTIGQARKFARENADKWHFTDAFEGSVRVDDRTTMDYQMIQKIMGALNATNLPSKVHNEMLNTIKDIYMSSVDEHSARQAGMKRKNRAGYDADMLRSFLSNARANATFLANIEHGGEMNDAFYKIQQEAISADGRRGGQDHFNTIAEHYAANLHYEDTPIQDRAVAFTSAWQLSTSLGYHLANATQGIQVSIPWLAGQFDDYKGAWKHLMKGYAQTRDITKGVTGFAGIDLSKVTNPKLREALMHAEDLNLLEVGMQEDLSHFDRFRTGYDPVDTAGGYVAQAVHKLRRVASMVETWNRVSSATAAYNMAIEKGKSHEQTLAYVEGVLRKTQGDFSRADAPLLLKKLPKVMVQYRKYQFMMGAFYVSSFLKAFNGATAEEKAIGKRMLAFKLFHTSMAAGVLGLPLMNLAALAMSALGGDGEDMEAKLRRSIGDKALADLLLHGPMAAMGFDMSSKLGDDKIFSIAPYTNFDLTSAKGLASTVVGVAGGPTFSQIGRMASGVNAMREGDIYKGVEKLLPKGFENAMASFRLGNEGYTLRNGDVMVKPEDISAFALTLNAFSLPATEIKTMQWMQHNQQSIKQYYTDHSKALEHQYAKAAKEGDAEAKSEVRKDWMELQASKREMRVWFNDNMKELKVQPLSTLMHYPQTVAKRERQVQRSYLDDEL